MRFEWDEAKNQINIRKHRIDFIDVCDIFNHPILALLDDDNDFEPRWIAIGWIQLIIGVGVYAEREGDIIRIISARKATKKEVRRCEQNI